MQSDFATFFPLRRGRVHEACGPAATVFAIATAAISRPQKTTLWVGESWAGETVNPLGLAHVLDPRLLLIARAQDQTDILAVAEEALRDGAISFVLINISSPLNLREGRRLQLAAKAGNTTGLCLIPEGMGSNAAETRWYTKPLFDPERIDSTLMRWEIIKNKSGTIGAWDVQWVQDMSAVRAISRDRPETSGSPCLLKHV